MVHAARASTASAPAPLPARHFLIGHAAIKNARNSPENNALNFSNRLKTANCSARFSRVFRPQNHDSAVAGHGSRFTPHQSLLTNHAFLIASRQILKIDLTHSQQTRKHFLIASFSATLPRTMRLTPHSSPLATHHVIPFLLRTNKPHRITILLRPLLKTKEKRFSIQYKFALRGISLPTEAAPSLPLRPELNRFLRRSRPNYLKIEIPLEVRMRRILFVVAVALLCALGLNAQQRNIDTQKSTMTIHVGKTGAFSGLGHEHEVRASIHSGTADTGAHPAVEIHVNARDLRVHGPRRLRQRSRRSASHYARPRSPR